MRFQPRARWQTTCEQHGVRGVLVEMAKHRQIIKLRCEMPSCYCPKRIGVLREEIDPSPRLGTIAGPLPKALGARKAHVGVENGQHTHGHHADGHGDRRRRHRRPSWAAGHPLRNGGHHDLVSRRLRNQYAWVQELGRITLQGCTRERNPPKEVLSPEPRGGNSLSSRPPSRGPGPCTRGAVA